jgi:hypothetical protein
MENWKIFLERLKGTRFFRRVNDRQASDEILIIQRKNNYAPCLLRPGGQISLVPAKQRPVVSKWFWWFWWEKLTYVLRNTKNFANYMPFTRAFLKSVKLCNQPRIILWKGYRVK